MAAKLEAVPVTGTTRASLGAQQAVLDWRRAGALPPLALRPRPHRPVLRCQPLVGMWQGNTLLLPWSAEPANLQVTHQGTGKPWLTFAIPGGRTFGRASASRLRHGKNRHAHRAGQPAVACRSVHPGDVLRVTLLVTARSDMGWVAITDPIPAGATVWAVVWGVTLTSPL